MNRQLLNIEGHDEEFFNKLEKYSLARQEEIKSDYSTYGLSLDDLARIIARLESEMLVLNHMFENGEDVESYLLSGVCGGVLDLNSPAYKKYVYDDGGGNDHADD